MVGELQREVAGLRVLVVEDELLTAIELQALLKERGCIVVGPAAGVDQALALLDDSGEPDIALLVCSGFKRGDLVTNDEEPSDNHNGNERQRYEKGQHEGGGRLVALLFHKRTSSTRAIVRRIISGLRLACKDGIRGRCKLRKAAKESFTAHRLIA